MIFRNNIRSRNNDVMYVEMTDVTVNEKLMKVEKRKFAWEFSKISYPDQTRMKLKLKRSGISKIRSVCFYRMFLFSSSV